MKEHRYGREISRELHRDDPEIGQELLASCIDQHELHGNRMLGRYGDCVCEGDDPCDGQEETVPVQALRRAPTSIEPFR